jgi:serine protease Do
MKTYLLTAAKRVQRKPNPVGRLSRVNESRFVSIIESTILNCQVYLDGPGTVCSEFTHISSECANVIMSMARMSRKCILAVAVVALLALSVGTWALSPSPGSSSGQSDGSNLYIDSDWSFPSGNGEPMPLPSFPPVITSVMPSVVSVTTEVVTSDLLGRQSTENFAGSGILIDSAGYIVTNNHVVEDADSIYVELADGDTFPAAVVGTDVLSDLAVIKIGVTDIPYAQWGNSTSLSVGQWVLAIGNALGEGITATEGIVSRLNVSMSLDNVEGTTLYGLIQTTAPVNPGNSGGPLVNMAGEVIGITSAKIVASDVEGMGFAISSNEAAPIIESLIRYGRVSYAWLGVALQTVDSSLAAQENLSVDKGALVVEVVTDSPAEAAGLRAGDVITRFADIEITDVADVIGVIRSTESGQEVEIVFVRGQDTKTTSARLAERPAS